MSACPSNTEAVIVLLQGAVSRQLDTAGDRTSHTAVAFLPEDFSFKLTKQLFMGGCTAEKLVLVMKILWGEEVVQNSREESGSDGKDGSVITDGS
ncbi:hypothetical protein, partial [Flavobacterium sp.]|uniref:hypothetical protein n=1 Tax=Flavobacterium sp. TaxID=239 RepID=UPI00374DD39C